MDKIKTLLDNKDDIPKKNIFMGELYVSEKPIILETILGSCIATCIFDSEKQVGGMNHFLMPGAFFDFNIEEMLEEKNPKYGIFAIEELIRILLEKGARKEHLVAKIFGASYVSSDSKKSIIQIQERNIKFVHSYLKMVKIPIISSYLGKEKALKILFWTHTGETIIEHLARPGSGEESFYEVDLKK